MSYINVLSFAPAARNWIEISCYPQILHVFDRVCNLINERREVLSIVTPGIGNGPFNLVIDDVSFFSRFLSIDSPISISKNRLILRDITINTANAKLWNPRPDWETLHARRNDILNQLMSLSVPECQVSIPNSLVSKLSYALIEAEISSAKAVTSQLAGLGQGLTPSGDDILMGAIYAVWILHPPEVADALAKEIANFAAPLTTSLSAAWLRSAGRGQAGILWHEFFDALLNANTGRIYTAMDKIISIGETSGTDAFAGFIGTIISFAETETRLCHS